MPVLPALSLVLFGEDLTPIEIALAIALLVISLGIHEAAHGWVALQRGDTTARDLGRITLNPVPHIDPFMTIVLPTITFFATNGMIFGGAKPVPVNYYNLRSPLRDMALVAMAGPGSNFLLAAFFFLCLKVTVATDLWELGMTGPRVLHKAIEFNLLLSAFNLLPIPPLDGSRVMTWLLPPGLREPYRGLERFGILIVIGLLVLVPAINRLIWSTMDVMAGWVETIVTLGGRW